MTSLSPLRTHFKVVPGTEFMVFCAHACSGSGRWMGPSHVWTGLSQRLGPGREETLSESRKVLCPREKGTAPLGTVEVVVPVGVERSGPMLAGRLRGPSGQGLHL